MAPGLDSQHEPKLVECGIHVTRWEEQHWKGCRDMRSETWAFFSAHRSAVPTVAGEKAKTLELWTQQVSQQTGKHQIISQKIIRRKKICSKVQCFSIANSVKSMELENIVFPCDVCVVIMLSYFNGFWGKSGSCDCSPFRVIKVLSWRLMKRFVAPWMTLMGRLGTTSTQTV